jgi:hypothetical protein
MNDLLDTRPHEGRVQPLPNLSLKVGMSLKSYIILQLD